MNVKSIYLISEQLYNRDGIIFKDPKSFSIHLTSLILKMHEEKTLESVIKVMETVLSYLYLKGKYVFDENNWKLVDIIYQPKSHSDLIHELIVASSSCPSPALGELLKFKPSYFELVLIIKLIEGHFGEIIWQEIKNILELE